MKNVFGLYLSYNENDSSSEILFGDANPLLSGENMTTKLNVTSDVYWQVSIASRSFNGVMFAPSSSNVIFDTGVPFIAMDISDFAIIDSYFNPTYNCIMNQSSLQYVCLVNDTFDITQFPSMTLNFTGLNHTINSTNYIRRINNTAIEILIIGVPQMAHWIIGNIFLNKYYMLFDTDNKRIELIIPFYKSFSKVPAIIFLIIIVITLVSMVAMVFIKLKMQKAEEERQKQVTIEINN